MAMAQKMLLGRKLHSCPRPQLGECSSTRVFQSAPRRFRRPPCMQPSIYMRQVFGIPPAATQLNKSSTKARRKVPSGSPTHPATFGAGNPKRCSDTRGVVAETRRTFNTHPQPLCKNRRASSPPNAWRWQKRRSWSRRVRRKDRARNLLVATALGFRPKRWDRRR